MKKIVVARVTGADVSMDALVRMMNIMNASSPAASASASPEEIRKNALDQVILRELALQEAARRELRVEKEDVSRAMDNIIMRLGHEQGFTEFLEKQQLTEDEVRAQVEKSLLLQLIFNKEVLNKISVSNDDVRREYESRKDQYVTPEGQMSYEEAKGRIEGKLKAVALEKRREEWEQELKKDAKIEIVESAAGSQ
jgi:hypothetical protein